jgi:hypothetical protein
VGGDLAVEGPYEIERSARELGLELSVSEDDRIRYRPRSLFVPVEEEDGDYEEEPQPQRAPTTRQALKEVRDLLKRPEPKLPPPDDCAWAADVDLQGPIDW